MLTTPAACSYGSVANTESTVQSSRRGLPTWRSLLVKVVVGSCLLAIVAIFSSYHPAMVMDSNDVLARLLLYEGLNVTMYLRRTSLHYHGAGRAQLYVFPRLDTTTGMLTLDATMTLARPDGFETYTMVSNRAYYSKTANGTARCIDPSHIPPIHELPVRLAEATRLASVFDGKHKQPIECIGGEWLGLEFGGEPYVVCPSLTSQLVRVIGHDIELHIEPLSDAKLPAIETLQGSDETSLNCPELPRPLSPTSKRVLVEDVSISSSFDFFSFNEPTCTCKGERKPCLFVHGFGELSQRNISSTFPFYWGDVHLHAPCCTDIQFTHFDTVNRGWINPSLQEDFCHAALRVSEPGSNDTTIGNLILVAHSMGNLLIAGAVANRRCHLSSNVTWIHLGGPMKGTMVANFFQNECTTKDNWNILKDQMYFMGTCPLTEGTLSLLHESTADEVLFAQYQAAQAVHSTYVTKAACGNNPFGLDSVYTPLFGVLGTLDHVEGRNDGVVSFDSCSVGLNLSDFDTTYESRHYKASVNHIDLSFRNSDGWWGSDRKPLKWFACGL
ncbi:unnamed protein product [Aphanomyces euteiches]